MNSYLFFEVAESGRLMRINMCGFANGKVETYPKKSHGRRSLGDPGFDEHAHRGKTRKKGNKKKLLAIT